MTTKPLLTVAVVVLLIGSGIMMLLRRAGMDGDLTLPKEVMQMHVTDKPQNPQLYREEEARGFFPPQMGEKGNHQASVAQQQVSHFNHSEQSSMNGLHETAASDITAEDEAVLALSQQVEVPTPLGPKFNDQLTILDDETLQVMTLHETLYESPGLLVAQSQDSQPVGPMRIEGYRVEEVTLPQATRVEIDGQETTVFTALRVTITGGPFPVGALPVVVWIDDIALGVAQPSPDLSSISAVTFDGSLLHEGGTIAISYGHDGAKTVLSETLRFGVHH